MSDELPMAPDTQRLSNIARSGAPLVENGLLKNILTSMVIAMHNADWRRHVSLDGSDTDAADQVKRNNRVMVLDYGRNCGMSLLAQLLAHENTSVLNSHQCGMGNFNQPSIGHGGPAHPADLRLFQDLPNAPVTEWWHEFVERVASGQCHSAIIFGYGAATNYAIWEDRAHELIQALPDHGRIFIIR